MSPSSGAVLVSSSEETLLQPGCAVRSLQHAELTVPAGALERYWSAGGLACLARTYWSPIRRRFRRVLRLIGGENGPRLVLAFAPLTLIRFGPPRLALGVDVAEVCWPIRGGILVLGDPAGTLRIEARKGRTAEPTERALLRLTVAVEDFSPRLRGRGRFLPVGTRLYRSTQLRIHLWQARKFFDAVTGAV